MSEEKWGRSEWGAGREGWRVNCGWDEKNKLVNKKNCFTI